MVRLKANKTEEGYAAQARASGKVGDILVETAFALRDLVEQISKTTGNSPDQLMDAISTTVKALPKRK